MKLSLIGICALWLLFSCGKADANVNSFDGTYVGYYHRNKKDTVQVSLLFQENQYSGFRDKKFCPILGKGTFEQNENSIYFEGKSHEINKDEAVGPVLNGEYTYEISADGSIRIWKNDGNVWDEYILRKSNDESVVYGITNNGNGE
jgi:hypothetical protein